TGTAPDPDAYRPADPARVAALAGARVAGETQAVLTDAEVAALRKKLNAWRWILWPLFPRGFAVAAGGRRLLDRPAAGRLADAETAGDCEIRVPALTIKEALANGHLSDLGITMFVRVRLLRAIDPRRVYGLFVLFQFDDYGHLHGPRALWRWTRAIL